MTKNKTCMTCSREVPILYKHKGIMKCGNCLNGNMPPLKVEDFMTRNSPLARMQEEPDNGRGWGSLRPRMRKAGKKLGVTLTHEEMKNAMFTGVFPKGSKR